MSFRITIQANGFTGYEYTMNFPSINAYNPEKDTGRDFMGQQSTIQTMTGVCIPSFTNATRKPRYYSFWAWAFKQYLKHSDSIAPDKAWSYLYKLETVLIMANFSRDSEYSGMPGIQGVSIPSPETPNNEKIPIQMEKLERATSYSAVQYSPSIGSLNIVRREDQKYLIGPIGSKLAEFFDQQIREVPGYEELIDPNSDSIPFWSLKNLQEGLSLENISPEERDCFIEIIEQDEENYRDPSDIPPRVQTACLFLDILGKHQVHNPDEILGALWSGAYVPDSHFKSIASAWEVIRARQFFQLGLESYLTSFSLFIAGQAGGNAFLDDHVKETLSQLRKNEFSDPKLEAIRIESETDQTFGDFVEAIHQVCRDNEYDEFSIESLIHAEHAERGHAHQDKLYPRFLFLGVVMHILLFKRFDKLKNSVYGISENFLQLPRDYRLSLETFNALMIRAHDLTVEEGLQLVLEEAMLKLHLGVAQDKLIQTHNFTFRFIHSQRGGFERPHDITINDPNATRNKSDAFMSILEYVDLWKYDDRKRMTLTRFGLEYLDTKISVLKQLNITKN